MFIVFFFLKSIVSLLNRGEIPESENVWDLCQFYLKPGPGKRESLLKKQAG